MAWAGLAKCLGARTVVSYESERGGNRRRREDLLNVTYPQSSPFFNPGTFRISRGGSRLEYVT
jgi:hypothetical protein